MKKMLMLVLCVLTSLSMIFASGSSEEESSADGASQAKDKVVMILPGLNDKDTIDPITGIKSLGLNSFEKVLAQEIPDVEVDLVSIPWDGWIQKLEAMMTSGEADIGFFTNQVAVPDWFADITPYLENDDVLNLDNLSNVFNAPSLAYLPYRSFNYPEATGNIYGLPLTQNNYCIVYDTKLFDQWGVDYPTEETTMHELVQMAKKMTGKNPVTGKQNYGAYIVSYWMEWFAVSYDAVKTMKLDNMDIENFDTAEYIDYIKDSPEVLQYFEDMATIVECSPKGVSTKSGNEKFLMDNNDIAINFDVLSGSPAYLGDMYAGLDEITDRFKAIGIPTGAKNGMQGFPEFFKLGVAKKAKNPEAAWKVLRTIMTDNKILNFYLMNYGKDKLPAVVDTTGIDTFDYPLNQYRKEYQSKTGFITDDYWTWRIALQNVNNEVISKTITPVEAREKFYEYATKWVADTKSQLGK
jgi:ABC-type glycerol-3-phosphate transport system substrate-binding protein